MYRPEDKKDNEEMVRIPEPLEVSSSDSFERRGENQHQAGEHDKSCPAWASGEVDAEKTSKPHVVLSGKSGEIIPMSKSVKPRKEDD